MTSIEEVLNLEVNLLIIFIILGSALSVSGFVKINFLSFINWTFLWMCLALGCSYRILKLWYLKYMANTL